MLIYLHQKRNGKPMDETVDVDVFEDNGVLMLRYPDGAVEAYDDYLRRTEPGMSYDNATGELIVATPASAEAAAMPGGETAPDVFGDTTARMARPYLETAADLAANAGRRPTYFENPLMQGVERTGQYIGDMGLAGLNAVMGGMYGGAGLLGEAFGGDTQDERRLARDLAAMIDTAGPAPEGRMLGLLGDAAAANRVPATRADFLADESGALPGMGRGLPEPRTDAEAMARDILQLRAEGRADEVTEPMMLAADPQYMYMNTPLPMDTASRMARAEAMGARPEYHGTTSGSEMRYPRTDYSSGTRKGIGFVTSSDPYVSSSYADPSYGSVFPMMNRVPSGGFPTIDAGGEIWSQIPGDAMVSYAGREVPVSSYASGPADMGGVFDTNQVSRGAAIEGDPGVQFNNILDRSIHAPRPKTDDGMEIMREFQRRSSEPSTVTMRQDTRGMRSRFARFDPAFANLRNLNAALAAAGVPLGLLAMQPDEEQY
jgi:hypothetical protein